MKEKILVVDDEPRMVRLVSEVLRAVGYDVLAVANGEAAIETVALERPDLVLLDIRLGQAMDGYEVCRRIREFSTLPIIMLTAKAREQDLLQGFEVGTDDYLTKPFSSKELVARVQAAIRRAQPAGSPVPSTVRCGDLKINLARRTVEVKGAAVSLTRTEYKLLCQMAMHPNRVLLHEDLLTEVWGPEYRNDVDYLRAYVRYLRRKLEPDPAHPQYILTSPGQGYMLNCPEEEKTNSTE